MYVHSTSTAQRAAEAAELRVGAIFSFPLAAMSPTCPQGGHVPKRLPRVLAVKMGHDNYIMIHPELQPSPPRTFDDAWSSVFLYVQHAMGVC